MRKFAPLVIICIISFILLGNSQITNEGIILREYSPASLLKEKLRLSPYEAINDIIILPEEPFEEMEALPIIENIRKLPPYLLNKIHEHDIFIKLFTGKLTDNPTAKHLKGVIPRGYKSDKKWDDVPGIGGGDVVLVKIGHSERGMGHGSVNLELHELAHSLDKIVFQEIRYDPVFLSIWSKEKYSLFKDRSYFITFPEEYFAESFAMFYYDEENHHLLKSLAPETYEYIQHLK